MAKNTPVDGAEVDQMPDATSATMRVKLLSSRVDQQRRFQDRGEIIEVPAAEALRMFRAGSAERVID